MSQTATIHREPSIPTLYAADLNWLIAQYISWQRTQLDQQSTVDCYACKLRWFVEWWEETGPSKEWLLRQADLEEFERHLRAVESRRTRRKLAWHSRKDVLARLREMFHWAFDKSYTEQDYAAWVPKADGGPPTRRAAGIVALMRLLHEANNNRQALRDRTMIAMFIGMGVRRGEIHNLNVEDVVIEADLSGYARVTGKRTKANPNGQRDAAFDSATGRVVVAYLDGTGYNHGPMFRNANNQRLSTQGIYQIVKATIIRSGLENQIQACHDLRRAFATHAARNQRGPDAADRLRRQLGHAKYSQTADYTLLDVDDLRVNFISPMTMMPDDI